MKTFGKIIICAIVVLVAIGVAYLVYNGGEKETNSNTLANTNSQNINSNVDENTTNEIDENKDYIGIEEENAEEPKEDEEPETNTKPEVNQEQEQKQEEQSVELTGKDKAIDIVQKQYAIEGQNVRFDHMEGTDYIIKVNDGTAVTWYLVDGTTWEATEY